MAKKSGMNRSVALKRARRAAERAGHQPPKWTVKARSKDGKCELLLRRRNRPGDTGPCDVFLLASSGTWAKAAHAAAMVMRPGGTQD